MLIEPALIVPTPFTKPVVGIVARFGKTNPFVMVSVTVPFTVRVEPFPTVMERLVLSLSTVNVNPSPIMISSPTAGIVPKGHGASGTVELQFPDPVVVIVADHADSADNKDKITTSIQPGLFTEKNVNRVFKW